MSFIVRRLIFYVVAAWVALTINFFIPRLLRGVRVQNGGCRLPSRASLRQRARLDAECARYHYRTTVSRWGNTCRNPSIPFRGVSDEVEPLP